MGGNDAERVRPARPRGSGDRRADGGWAVDARTGRGRHERRRARFRRGRLSDAPRCSPSAIAAARKLTTGPLGVNLFVPQPSAAHTRGDRDVRGGAGRRGAALRRPTLGEPRYDDDDWAAKVDVVLDLRPRGGVVHVRPAERRGVQAAARRGHRHRRHRHDAGPEAELAVGLRCRRAGGAGPVGGRAPRHVRSRRGARGRNRWPSCSPPSSLESSVPVVAAGGLVTADDVAG